MHSINFKPRPTWRDGFLLLSLGLWGSCLVPSVHASTHYGSLNNFDTVNDTGEVCHGFEIELEDLRTADVTYTYDWNHYGTPRLSEDSPADGPPRTLVRWESGRNPDGSWAAHTAVPTSVIAPTDGHQFTNPGVNFGGEHFGVGYRVVPTAVRYYWLLDDGAGHLVRGPQVLVSTPVFFVSPALGGGVQVQAEIPAPPEAPEAQVREFGNPVWVKEIRTTSHNDRKVGLRDLVSDDPDSEDDVNWRNNEPEWTLKESASLETAGWVPFTGATPVLEGKHHAIIEPTHERRFFRLQQP